MVKRDLPNAPAAGVFPSMLVEMKSGFRQVPERLAPGDALFLFTDGFEEAKHSFHDAAGEVHACEEPGLEKGADHGTHKVGETSEEFGIGRIEGVVNAVFSRGRYRLERAHAPAGGEELTFDFSTCTGTLREAVIALVAVEKVFRLVADPRAGDKDVVNVEPRLDAFLRDHFVQYKGWFAHRTEPETPLSPVSFTRMREDEQYDDLTIIVIKKK
jgi:hypothetical protein